MSLQNNFHFTFYRYKMTVIFNRGTNSFDYRQQLRIHSIYWTESVIATNHDTSESALRIENHTLSGEYSLMDLYIAYIFLEHSYVSTSQVGIITIIKTPIDHYLNTIIITYKVKSFSRIIYKFRYKLL